MNVDIWDSRPTRAQARYSREFVRREVLVGPDKTEELRKFLEIISADAAVVVNKGTLRDRPDPCDLVLLPNLLKKKGRG